MCMDGKSNTIRKDFLSQVWKDANKLEKVHVQTTVARAAILRNTTAVTRPKFVSVSSGTEATPPAKRDEKKRTQKYG